jgi:tRNA(Arg) A34 adenosine deaminase TadA
MIFPPNLYMLEAIEQAKLAKEVGDFPFGAVVVCDGKVMGKGKCEDNTTGDVTDHAELRALRQACRNLGRNNLQDCTIYCTNEPCPMCAAGIFQAKIAHVIFAVTREDLPNILRQRSIRIGDLAKDSGYPVEIQTGVMKDEVMELFKDVVKK